MKINVGDYIRTKDGKIMNIQVLQIIKDINCDYVEINYEKILRNNIVKSSSNIIDLIEVGDYVNGKLVTTSEDVYTTDNIYIGKEVFVNHDELIIEEDIENIVTHEMFESMQYKVGE